MSKQELLLDVIEVNQRMGTYYISSIKAKDLLRISYIDRARMENGEDERASYLGIQRKLDNKRVKKIADFVMEKDSAFPTSILLSLNENCVTINNNNQKLQLQLDSLTEEELDDKVTNNIISNKNIENYKTGGLAKVLDGQHRLAGLAHAIEKLKTTKQLSLFKDETNDELLKSLEDFELDVAFFIGYDLHEQAKIFSNVNLSQTKVNKSLVYNLEEYSKKRSPQQICHNIAKILDTSKNSPFYHYIKMLGLKTDGRNYIEPLTQATFVESLISLLSKNPERDRDLANRMKLFNSVTYYDEYTNKEYEQFVLRKLYEEKKDAEIMDIIWNYFTAVKNRWPNAWGDVSNSLLPKNNCFRALMKFLRDKYLSLVTIKNNGIPSSDEFMILFKDLKIQDEDFDSSKGIFPRGDGGMSKFYKYLIGQIEYEELKNE